MRINNLTELLCKYFLLYKIIAEHIALSNFIQLTRHPTPSPPPPPTKKKKKNECFRAKT